MKLHAAVKNSDVVTIQKIIGNGADLEELDECGYTPLQIAIFRGDASVFGALLGAGANLNSIDGVNGYPDPKLNGISDLITSSQAKRAALVALEELPT